jgi:hypothetical protein
MCQARIAERSVYSLVLVIVTASVHAEPILLAEWTRSQDGHFESGPAPATIPFRFMARRDATDLVGTTWTQQVGHADVGQTFEAPLTIVTPIAESFLNPEVRFGGGVSISDLDIVIPLVLCHNLIFG